MKKIIFSIATCLSLLSCSKEEVTPTTEVKNYTNFKITSIQVNKIPMVDASGSSWDTFDGPDLKFNIENFNEDVLYKGSSRYDNLLSSSLPAGWNFTPSYEITNFEVSYFFSLYDHDYPDDDDKIGYVGINFNQHKSGYPNSITKISTDGSISITINGNWY